MPEYTIEKARNLLNSEKFKDAAAALDTLLGRNRNNGELWYLRSLVSLKLKNYENAHECLERALWISKRAEYYKINGMAYMETYEFELAIEQFENAALLNKKDAGVFFYIAICHLFLNNPLGREYLEKAYILNKKKTGELIIKFYSMFFRGNAMLNQRIKKELEINIKHTPI